MTTEIWRPIAGYDYEVSSHGRVRSQRALKKLTLHSHGYFVVGLWRANKGWVPCVHWLVAEAFLGPRPKGRHVNHIDGDKRNNNVSNLEYVSLQENTAHAVTLGLIKRGDQNHAAKLTAEDVRQIRQRLAGGERGVDLAAEFGVGQVAISQVKTGARWRHLT